ncbi:Lrp/AsnC ligand binding domain-containing protein [Bernardetia sp.]|uniref:Lrp/AsnC ligand binding domain-containing protein n=1 Tax=Bernardetia sp. TaxID=1937974 RepID=UPI0025BB4BA6|nr:Lrp/AsnC ligand binding domain-containing protein [Bernardetia sp.]
MSKNSQIDSCDLRILSELTDDAKMPYTEVADRVFVSGGTVHVRMKKMQDLGIVRGASLTIDYAKLGYDVTAFLGIYLERSSMYDEAVEQLCQIPEILSLHYTTGSYSIFAKIICKDTKHLREVLHDKIQKVPGIVRTETFISLEERVERAPLLKQLAEESKKSEEAG